MSHMRYNASVMVHMVLDTGQASNYIAITGIRRGVYGWGAKVSLLGSLACGL